MLSFMKLEIIRKLKKKKKKKKKKKRFRNLKK